MLSFPCPTLDRVIPLATRNLVIKESAKQQISSVITRDGSHGKPAFLRCLQQQRDTPMVIKQLFTLPPQPVISSPDCDPALQAPFSRSADGVSAVVGDAPQDMAGPKKALGRTSNRRAEVAGAWTWQLAQEHDAIDGCGRLR